MENTAINPKNMNLSVEPGDNFYEYANGNWLKKNPIPAKNSRYGSFDILSENNVKKLKKIFKEAAKNVKTSKDANIKKIGNFYLEGMNTKKIDKKGIKPIVKYLDEIEKIKTTNELINKIAHFHTLNINPLFHVFADQDEKNSEFVILQLMQGGLGLPDRDYYLDNKDEQSRKIRLEYLKHVSKMLKLIGISKVNAKNFASIILDIETQLAEISMDKVERRDPDFTYNKMKLVDLKKQSANFNWDLYFKTIGVKDLKELNNNQPDFFKGISKLLKSIKIDDWKIYLKWNLINKTASYLNAKIEKEHFKFYGTILSGTKKMKPRWERVINASNNAMGEAIGQLYVEKHFPPQAKIKMTELVSNLKKTFKHRIGKLTWMNEETKKKAIEKLEVMNFKIGYPDKWMSYKNLVVSDESYVSNYLNANNFNFKYEMSKVNKPVDKGEWHMYPQTVNAYFNPTMNEIVFPAAILQPPFFYIDGDAAVNYGAIGMVIAHEMTHGFDDQGRKYNKNGNLDDWWTSDDAKKFAKYTNILIKQFDNYFINDNLHVNGNLTLGENISDLGGVSISLDALNNEIKNKKINKIYGYTQTQRFFLSYAQIWRQNIRKEELIKQVKNDPHSPAIARVNCIVANVDEFYDAFKIKQKNKCFIPNEKRAKIW